MSIKIKGVQKETVEIEISEYDLLKKTMDLVLSKAGLDSDCFIQDGEVYIWSDHYHGSHSKTWLKKATKADRIALDVVKYLDEVSKLPEKNKSVG